MLVTESGRSNLDAWGSALRQQSAKTGSSTLANTNVSLTGSSHWIRSEKSHLSVILSSFFQSEATRTER